MSHDIIPDIRPDVTADIGSEMISYLVQDGLVPPLDKEASGIITVREEIIKAYASKHSLNARAINDLIKDVLKNPYCLVSLTCFAMAGCWTTRAGQAGHKYSSTETSSFFARPRVCSATVLAR